MALRIKIEEQHTLLLLSETGGKIDGSGGFPAPAFLIGNGNDLHRACTSGFWSIKKGAVICSPGLGPRSRPGNRGQGIADGDTI
jgi:hypothetical protein